MLFGITVKHLRLLCENSWNGGFNYTPEQVGMLTVDQVVRLLSPLSDFGLQGKRKKVNHEQAVALSDKDGFIKAKDAEGNGFRGRWFGKSLAQRIRDGEVHTEDAKDVVADLEKRRGIELNPPKKEETPRERRKRERNERIRRRELRKKIKEMEQNQS